MAGINVVLTSAQANLLLSQFKRRRQRLNNSNKLPPGEKKRRLAKLEKEIKFLQKL